MTKSSNTEGFTRKIWKFFASVKLSVAILLSLAATSIIGTVIPQNGSAEVYIHQYGEVFFKLFNTLDFFDMYHSWWFRVLLCLLTINLIVCSIHRLTSTWKIIFPDHPSFDANRFQNAKNRQEWTSTSSPETLKAMYDPYIGKRFSISLTEKTKDGYLIFGEKGRWTRLGVYAVHLSIIFMITGGLIGSIFGFDGSVNIPEGQSTDTIFLQNDPTGKKLDFQIRCEDFDLSFYDSGMPKEYRSSLSIIKNGRTMAQKDIIVNDPLRFEGINIFQSSYGEMPSDRLTVTFTERESGLLYDVEAMIKKPIDMPGNSGKLIIEDFRTNFSYSGFNLGKTFICTMVPTGGEPETLLISVDHPRFDMMRQGDFIITISNIDFKYYTGLQVTKDPGVPAVYAGFLFMIIGCYITFFMFHQAVCIKLSTTGSGAQIELSGISGKNRPGMNAIILRMSNHLKRLSAA
ncbi:MAG: cytochrome c biogenesis protein ResB [Desulfobacteraceae bacterium]|nr:MAG: cytochrome c biogenesis protein ResB [Desulfobacteraceae bacterium]